MSNIDWSAFAQNLIQSEEQNLAMQQPPGYGVFVEWKGDTYAGSFQHVAPDYSNEIGLLSKTSSPIPQELRDAVLVQQPDRVQLTAEEALNLEGRVHIVRKVGNHVGAMTSEQLAFMQGQSLGFSETNSSEFGTSQTEIYVNGKRFDPSLN